MLGWCGNQAALKMVKLLISCELLCHQQNNNICKLIHKNGTRKYFSPLLCIHMHMCMYIHIFLNETKMIGTH